MQHLLDLLDEEVTTLQALVQCTQTEQQHLLAFEPEPLESLLVHKRALLAREELLRMQREQAVRTELGARGFEGSTLTNLVEALAAHDAGWADKLRGRRDLVRALLTALTELTSVAALHARRQLQWTRTSRRRLAREQQSSSYDRAGRPEARYGGGMRLNASV